LNLDLTPGQLVLAILCTLVFPTILEVWRNQRERRASLKDSTAQRYAIRIILVTLRIIVACILGLISAFVVRILLILVSQGWIDLDFTALSILFSIHHWFLLERINKGEASE
jgi:formate-dependent nitrite reductase membrane component NrfD